MFVEKDARTLAREILAMDQAEYAAAFKGSAMKRAKLQGLKRNACMVLGNIATADDLAVLEAIQSHEHEVVREHVAWAILQIDALNNTGSRMDGVGRSDCGERA
ncbi:hypothetical protein [Gemmatimonas sp.]|uniref:hypothetical protein n=1 Tax=Gemmatimonas sp. TaxID=1962908 RepID=UPI003561A1F8